QLSDASRSHLMLMWLLASRHKNRIPYDEKYVAAKISARGKIDFAGLLASGFITLVEDNASTLASAVTAHPASKSGDVEERERREEKEGEENRPPIASENGKQPPPSGESGRVFAAIRKLVQERHTPTGTRRYIRTADVEKIGSRALVAFDSIGGSERFTDTTEKIGFVLRDFERAYNANGNGHG
ncbi:MAG TPA: hypothetical protein VGP82_06400, partial [Ktedonobacterales bacterium]|nr:hypothetical protein [Ktedonobacterales bacterium]